MSSPLVTFRELVGAEFLKLRTTRTAWIVLSIGFAITAGFTLLTAAFGDATVLSASEALNGLALAGTPVGLVMLVVGVLGMAGEFRYGTITYTFLATPRRALVVVLKLGVFLVVGVVVAAVALVLIQLVLAIVLAARGIAVPWPRGDIWWFYARIALTTGLFAALGVAVAALLRSQVLAVALVLSWLVIDLTVMLIILPMAGLERARAWLPLLVFTQATGLLDRMGGGETPLSLLSPNTALLVGVGYIAVIAVAAVLTTMRRDVT